MTTICWSSFCLNCYIDRMWEKKGKTQFMVLLFCFIECRQPIRTCVLLHCHIHVTLLSCWLMFCFVLPSFTFEKSIKTLLKTKQTNKDLCVLRPWWWTQNRCEFSFSATGKSHPSQEQVFLLPAQRNLQLNPRSYGGTRLSHALSSPFIRWLTWRAGGTHLITSFLWNWYFALACPSPTHCSPHSGHVQLWSQVRRKCGARCNS